MHAYPPTSSLFFLRAHAPAKTAHARAHQRSRARACAQVARTCEIWVFPGEGNGCETSSKTARGRHETRLLQRRNDCSRRKNCSSRSNGDRNIPAAAVEKEDYHVMESEMVRESFTRSREHRRGFNFFQGGQIDASCNGHDVYMGSNRRFLWFLP